MKRIGNTLCLVVLVALLIGGPTPSVRAQSLEKYYALLTYKLTDYLLWPENPEVKTIGIFGNSKVIIELNNIVKVKREQKIRILKITSPSQISECQVLYLPTDQTSKFDQLLKESNNYSVVLVTEASDLAEKGAGISFFLKDSRLKMRLNRSAVENKEIKISTQLLSLVETI